MPRDYIALLGDSYAEGQGDGLLDADGDRAKALHSAHGAPAAHRTRRDQPRHRRGGQRAGDGAHAGAHPARRLLSLSARSIRRARSLVYFYEGNDLEENGFIVRALAPAGGASRARNNRALCRASATRRRRRCAASRTWPRRRSRWRTSSSPTPKAGDAAQALRAQQGDGRGRAHAAPALQKPPVELDPRADRCGADGVRCVARMAQRAIYPSPRSRWSICRRRPRSTAMPTRRSTSTCAGRSTRCGPFRRNEIYAASQRTCEQIRAMTLAHSARFIDMRPALRAGRHGRTDPRPARLEPLQQHGLSRARRDARAHDRRRRRARNAAIGTSVAGNSVRSLPLKGEGRGGGRLAPSTDPTRRFAPTSPFQGEMECD